MNITSVLVVDDDSAVCHMLRLMLPDGQYEVQTGQSVAEALEAIEQKPFEVYVLTTSCRTVADSMSQSGFGRKGVKLQSFLSQAMTEVPSRCERRNFVSLISSRNPSRGRRSVTP